jgi:hypothetical protein
MCFFIVVILDISILILTTFLGVMYHNIVLLLCVLLFPFVFLPLKGIEWILGKIQEKNAKSGAKDGIIASINNWIEGCLKSFCSTQVLAVENEKIIENIENVKNVEKVRFTSLNIFKSSSSTDIGTALILYHMLTEYVPFWPESELPTFKHYFEEFQTDKRTFIENIRTDFAERTYLGRIIELFTTLRERHNEGYQTVNVAGINFEYPSILIQKSRLFYPGQ